MKILSKKGLFPWFTIVAGALGFGLQCLLFSEADGYDRLPDGHFAGIASVILFALTLGVIWWSQRKKTAFCRDGLTAPCNLSAAGIGLSAFGFMISSFSLKGDTFLHNAIPFLGAVAALVLLYIAFHRAKGLSVNPLYYCIIIVFMVFRTMTACSEWSSEPQLLRYFFPLLACVFLLLTTYYRTELELEVKHPRSYIFFSQAALFCCILSCASGDWLFYLTGGIWLLADCPVLTPKTTEETYE